MRLSDCCFAILIAFLETPICSSCLEHCEEVNENEV